MLRWQKREDEKRATGGRGRSRFQPNYAAEKRQIFSGRLAEERYIRNGRTE